MTKNVCRRMNNRENGSLVKACHGAKRTDKRRLRRFVRLSDCRKIDMFKSTGKSESAIAHFSHSARKSDEVDRVQMRTESSDSSHANNRFDHADSSNEKTPAG